MRLDRQRTERHLKSADLRSLFIEELGWDNPGSRHEEEVDVTGQLFSLTPVAEKRGVKIFRCNVIPDRTLRQKIEKEITKRAFEHLIIFLEAENKKQIWQWVAREKGKPDAFREHTWRTDRSPDPLLQKLDHITFSLEEEEALTLAGTTLRLRDAFDREKITKKFYDAFKKQHDAFLGFIEGLTTAADKQWYASLMLNRLMFVYFIQKKGFLDGDINYLKNRLIQVRETQGEGKFLSFYRAFLLKLFHGGLATPMNQRDEETAYLIGRIPYLNGGLFEPHVLEGEGSEIQIADEAFEAVFAFFDQYEWTLDTRAIERADGKEINPDVLGHIFEKYINQKQMGAYYTKEDITDYITKNTVIPWLFQNAQALDKVAFEANGFVWRLLAENPNSYIYPAVSHGAHLELPQEISAGINAVSKRRLEQGGSAGLRFANRNLARNDCKAAAICRGPRKDQSRSDHGHRRPDHLQLGSSSVCSGRDPVCRKPRLGSRFLERNIIHQSARSRLRLRCLSFCSLGHPLRSLRRLFGEDGAVCQRRSGTGRW